MEVLGNYVVAAIMAICLGIGYIIKNSLDFIPNKFIPLIMGILGVFLNVWMKAWTFTPEVLLGGLASGLASTGAFELVKQIATNGETLKTGEDSAGESNGYTETTIQTRAPGDDSSGQENK